LTKLTGDPREAQLVQIKTEFDADPQAFDNLTDSLSQHDLAMIGTVVQAYSYAQFNARRLVSALEYVALGNSRAASRLQDAQVFPRLATLAEKHLPDSNIKDGIILATQTLEMHHHHRHHFAHWAVRRVKARNALAFFSMNAREIEKRHGDTLEPEEAKYGILGLDGFGAEVKKLLSHADYLAKLAAHVESNIGEFAEELAKFRKQRTGFQT
jgi:hypothetical protein